MSSIAQNTLSTVGLILLAMTAVAALEAIIPLRARSRGYREHLAPNLALTFLAFATSSVLNAGVVLTLLWLHTKGWGLLNTVELPPILATTAVVVVLDLAFYAMHVAMHEVPALWRYHRVHHSDPALDVTSTIRQHPGESVLRYVVILCGAAALGASPAAFGIYRAASALNGLLEHANIRLPERIDTALSWITTWPNMHKVHHSRLRAHTDSNYGNLFSVWDRVFSTFTPARAGATVVYGLDGFDSPEQQSTLGLLMMPHSDAKPEPVAATSGG